MTQHKAILRYLESGKSLTVATALSELGVYALSQRVRELKLAGHKIEDTWEERNGKRYKRYWLNLPTELFPPSEVVAGTGGLNSINVSVAGRG